MDRQWRQYRDGSIQALDNSASTSVESTDTAAQSTFLGKTKDELPSLIPQLENDDIDFALDFDPKRKKHDLSLEESRKLLVGVTHSLKNTLCKLSMGHPSAKYTKAEQSSPSGSERAIESPEGVLFNANGEPDPLASTSPANITPQAPLRVAFTAGQFQSFSYKTSTYQLHYLEIPTGWRFILQTPNPPLLHATSKGTGKQKDMTKMFMSLTLSTSPQSSEFSSIAPSPPLVHVKMELFYELVVEHIIRHPFYILQTGNSVFNRAGFLRIIDSAMQEVARGEFAPKLD